MLTASKARTLLNGTVESNIESIESRIYNAIEGRKSTIVYMIEDDDLRKKILAELKKNEYIVTEAGVDGSVNTLLIQW